MTFKRKINKKGHRARYNARLITKGYVQKQGDDCDKPFAPVVPFSVLLLVHGRFILKGWHLHHADIFTAFLNGKTDGELYVEWNALTNRLLRSLYVFKQSPRLWYETLSASLQQYGFIQLESCEFVSKITKNKFEVTVMVYVDDIIILSDARN